MKSFVIASVLAQVVQKVDGIIVFRGHLVKLCGIIYAYKVKREKAMYLRNSQSISARTS